MTIPRTWHAVIALLVLGALALQIWVAVDVPSSPASTQTGLLAGAPFVGRLVRVFSFFTIESNVLCGVVSASLALHPQRDGAGWRVLRLDALVGIAVTGIVYSAVLAQTHTPIGWKQIVVNDIVHYAVPIMMVVGWLLFGPRPRIAPRTVLLSLAWPVLWLVYTLVRGEISNWYPYPFVDVTALGYARVALNAAGVVLVLGVVASLFALGDRKLNPTARASRARL